MVVFNTWSMFLFLQPELQTGGASPSESLNGIDKVFVTSKRNILLIADIVEVDGTTMVMDDSQQYVISPDGSSRRLVHLDGSFSEPVVGGYETIYGG
ncbi:MAG: hypothetical protein AAF242_19215, partial [Bacteroidota bacterium]